MTTNSYLEYFLTLLGWVVNNGLWNAISATGLFALPLLIKLRRCGYRPEARERMKATKPRCL